MAGEVDRDGRPAEQQCDGVPGVGVETGAVQQGHLGIAVAEAQSTEDATVVEGDRDTLGAGQVGAQGLRLLGQVAELADVFNHGHILLLRRVQREMPDQSARLVRVELCVLLRSCPGCLSICISGVSFDAPCGA